MKTIRVADRFDVVCETALEVWRAQTFTTKEPGTIVWLDALGPNDVLVDVGANIGLYSLYAASRGCQVYAFEPHLANAAALLKNVIINQMSDRISVSAMPLGEKSGVVQFNYRDTTAGSSGSQADSLIGEDGKSFAPVAIEIKNRAVLHHLVLADDIKSPTALKIDVDGQEYSILRGSLAIPTLRSVQVEVHMNDCMRIIDLFHECGWSQDYVHFTSRGQKAVDAGANPALVTHNAVFKRAA